MPIAIMNPPEIHAPSPTSPRMTKAAFFRARSPPVLDRTSATGTARAHSPNDLAARFAQMETGSGRGYHSASGSEEELVDDTRLTVGNGSRGKNGYGQNEGYASSVGTTGHTPEMGQTASVPYTQPEGYRGGRGNGVDAGGEMGSSDEMVMSLLAGQAVVDCETMVVGRWEEVESWKKVCFRLNINRRK